LWAADLYKADTGSSHRQHCMTLQLYREGRIFQAYAGQQHSYQSNAQRTGEEETIFPGIGVEYTLLRSKIVEISKKQQWKSCATYVKKKGTDDAFKIYVHATQANVYLVEAEYMVPSISVCLLISRADFLDYWVAAIPDASLVKRLQGVNAYIVRLSVRNPISSMFGCCEKYIKVSYAMDDAVKTKDGACKRQKAFITYSPVTEAECVLYDIPKIVVGMLSPDFFDFQSVLFVVYSSQDTSMNAEHTDSPRQAALANPPNQHEDEVTTCHVYAEGMKFTKNSPAFLNAMYFPDFLHKMCTNWAIQARCLDLRHAKFGSSLLALHQMSLDNEIAYPVLANQILPPHSAPVDNTNIDDLLDIML